ncbi:MAG: DUF5686 family protein [Cyclobacteriaceae bacterium]|nr:DUF5686 family protein [Cyclobacteriaceae bacterium]
MKHSVLLAIGAIRGLVMLMVVGVIMHCLPAHAQNLQNIHGTIIDSETGEPLPFVNVYLKSTSDGAITDANGQFTISIDQKPDTIIVSFVGYISQLYPTSYFTAGKETIKLKPVLVNLTEVVFNGGENPAWAIIRNAVSKKQLHDHRTLKAFEYSSYNRIEVDIENLPLKFDDRKLMSDVWAGIDTSALDKNSAGKAVLPIFLSESSSRYYVKNNPHTSHEDIEKTKIAGIAIEDGSMMSQLVGSAYQNYNFYENWLNILDKEFISPLADGWRGYYDFFILDTVMVENDLCYELEVVSKVKEEPAFSGTIWITTNEFALRKIDVAIEKSASLNFIESLAIKQELEKTIAGPWLAPRSEVKIDVSNLGKNMASFWITMLNTTRDWKINDVKDKRFYANEVFLAENYNNHDDAFWSSIRPPDLTENQLKTYAVIDTLKEVPRVKSLVNFIKLATSGYWRRGKFDIGPYLYAYAYNNFEGHSFRLGGKTNEYFHNKLTLRGRLGYGTMDNRWKYGFTTSYIIDRKPWTQIELHSAYEVQQAGINPEDLIEDNYIFYAATRWQTFRRPYYITKNSVSFQTEPVKGFSYRATIRYDYYDPQYSFYYYTDPGNPESAVKTTISSPTVRFFAKWAHDETFLQNGNERISMGPGKWPIVGFDYTYGLGNVMNSDAEFHKIQLQYSQHLRLGKFGDTYYKLNGGQIIGTIPYLLLENHIGNESMFYTTGAFNTMNYFEFVSDKWASMRVEQYFQGLFFNRIPLIQKLKWRLLATANVLYGSLSPENTAIMATNGPDGEPTMAFGQLDPGRPFVEMGYGIENIFRFVRVDGIHRLTYRDSPEAQKFALRISAQFKL